MLINLFQTVRSSGVPCTLRELLDLLGALEKQLVYANIDDFYYLSRAILVKDEKHYDKFDKAFDIYFKGLETLDDVIQALIPDEWLRKEFEKFLTPEELEKIKSMGGLEKLLDEFKKRLEEQKGRHEGGDKWVGTGGTSPYGNSGMNPEGIRVGGEGKQNKAVKVWEKRVLLMKNNPNGLLAQDLTKLIFHNLKRIFSSTMNLVLRSNVQYFHRR